MTRKNMDHELYLNEPTVPFFSGNKKHETQPFNWEKVWDYTCEGAKIGALTGSVVGGLGGAIAGGIIGFAGITVKTMFFDGGAGAVLGVFFGGFIGAFAGMIAGAVLGGLVGFATGVVAELWRKGSEFFDSLQEPENPQQSSAIYG